MRYPLSALPLWLLIGCASSAAAPAPVAAPAVLDTKQPHDGLGLPQGAEPEPGIFTSGQPAPAQLAQLPGKGVRTVINLRPEAEMDFDEEAKVEGLGMHYVSIPVAGPDDLTVANAKDLARALQGEGGFLVHCSSSNRVGGLFALTARFVWEVSAEEAMEMGRLHGMQPALEPAVEAKLAAAPQAH